MEIEFYKGAIFGSKCSKCTIIHCNLNNHHVFEEHRYMKSYLKSILHDGIDAINCRICIGTGARRPFIEDHHRNIIILMKILSVTDITRTYSMLYGVQHGQQHRQHQQHIQWCQK